MNGEQEVRYVRRLLTLVIVALAAVGLGTRQPATAAGTRQVVEVQMKEFAFVPATVTLRAGAPVELRLVNRGVVEHEFMVYDTKGLHMAGMDPQKMHKELEARSYFRGIPVQVEGKAKTVERMGKDVVMLLLDPGQQVVLRFVATKKGTFEMGCHTPGHYEAGMKGQWVVR